MCLNTTLLLAAGSSPLWSLEESQESIWKGGLGVVGQDMGPINPLGTISGAISAAQSLAYGQWMQPMKH